MDVKVVITDQDLIDCITNIAKSVGKSVDEYATGIIDSWIRAHLRNTYIGYTRNANLSELKTKIGNYSQVKVIK